MYKRPALSFVVAGAVVISVAREKRLDREGAAEDLDDTDALPRTGTQRD